MKTIKKTKAIAGLTPRGETDLRRFSVYPSRAVMDLSLSINDIRTLLALGLYTSGSGVAFPTLQTIGAYTGQGTAGNQAALRRLVDKGYIRKLQPKWYAGQSSPWLTDHSCLARRLHSNLHRPKLCGEFHSYQSLDPFVPKSD